VARGEAQRTADAAAHAGAGHLIPGADGRCPAIGPLESRVTNPVRGEAVDIDLGHRHRRAAGLLQGEGAGAPDGDRNNPESAPSSRGCWASVSWTCPRWQPRPRCGRHPRRSACCRSHFPIAGVKSGDGTNCIRVSRLHRRLGPCERRRLLCALGPEPAPPTPTEWVYNDNHTGYSDADRGTADPLRPGDPGGWRWSGRRPGGVTRWNPSWWNAFRTPGTQGTPDFRERVRGCVDGSDPPLGYG
jgi:hypothetical protein